MNAETFKQTPWLYAVCQPHDTAEVIGTHDEVETLLNDDPDAFFEPPYSKPYDDWCVEDHRAAEQLDARYKDEVTELAEQVYKVAWAWCPHEEFCALVSEDVETIYSLLLINGEDLRPFTGERMNWYVQGRVPWGYKGEYPNGRWIII